MILNENNIRDYLNSQWNLDKNPTFIDIADALDLHFDIVGPIIDKMITSGEIEEIE